MKGEALTLSGIYPPICTAFKKDGALALEELQNNIRAYDKTPLAGYVVTGSTGEAVMLTTPEKLDVWEAVRDVVDTSKTLIAGTNSQSTQETVDLANMAADRGYHAALVISPFFYKAQMMKPETQVSFFTRVAEESKLPVILYNFPQMTGIDIPADTIAQIAEHDNIVGVKESSADLKKVEALRAALPAEIPLLVGASAVFDQCMAMGAAGGILALGNVLPQACCDIFTLFHSGDRDGASRLQAKVFEAASVPPKHGIQGLKYGMELMGFYGGPCREPLLPVTEEQKRAIEAAFEGLRP